MRENLQAAVDAGVDVVLLGVNWDQVVKASGASPDWSLTDNSVKFCLDHNLKVAFRILVSRDYEAINGFWTDDQTMQDASGRPLYANRQSNFSFSSEASVTKGHDFVRSVIQRYQYLQTQGKLLFVSVVTSPYAEMDYPFTNNDKGGIPEANPFDYSPASRTAYRQWLANRYSSVGALNSAYGTGYARFDDINPPQPVASPFNVFSGKVGEDWYVFRHQVLRTFIDKSIGTIRAVDPSIVIMNEHGSSWDVFSGLRNTYGFKDLAQLADGVKINDAPYYNHYFSTDLLRSNVAPGKWIMNEVDGQDQTVDLQTLYDQAEQCFRYGSQAVTFANFSEASNWARMKWVIQKLKATGVLDQPVTKVTPTASMSYKLSSVVHSGINESGAMGAYLALRAASGNQPVAIKLIEDLLGEAVPPTSETVAANKPPTVVSPIPNQTAVQGQFFSLTIPAGTFADADGRIVSVAVTGLPTGLAYEPINTIIRGTPTLAGTSQIVVTASDDKGATVADTFRLTVSVPVVVPTTPTNKPPTVVHPIGSLSMVQGTYSSLTIATSTFADPDGQIISYGISGLPAALSFNQDRDKLFIYGTPVAIGTSQIRLTASDNKGASVTDTFRLLIKSPLLVPTPSANQAPVVVSRLGSQSVLVGSLFIRAIPLSNFADSDGRIVRIDAAPLPAGISYDKTNRILSGTPTAVGTSLIVVTAFDDGGASVADTLRLVVTGLASSVPLIVTRLTDQTAVQGQTFRMAVPATMFTAPVGQSVNITVTGLPSGLVYSAATASITGVPTQTGVNRVVVQAANSQGASVADTFLFTVVPPPANRPPTVANPIPNQVAYQGVPFTLLIAENVFADADGQIASVAVSGLPLGLSYQTSTRTISGQPLLLGSTAVIVKATDDRGAAVADTFMLTVRIAQQQPVNSPPVVARAISNQVAYAGKSYSLVIPAATFSDADGVIAGIGVTGLPAGLNYETTTRLISGKPVLLGTSVVTVTATDDRKASVTTTFLLTVRDIPANQPPVIVRQIVTQSAVVNTLFTLPLSTNDFADADGQVVSVQVSGLPAGLTYSASDGQISGRPTRVGSSVVTVTATDDLGATTSFSFTLIVGTLDAKLVLFGNAGKTNRPVADADAIDISALPRLLNAYAETGSKTGSISLAMLGPATQSATANGNVCTLFPGQDGFTPQIGQYTATITVYAGLDRTGGVLLTKIIHFDILVTK